MAGINLQSIISDIKVFLYGGFQTLPLTMAGTLLLLGLFTANYSVLFFLVGFLLLTPLLTMGLNSLMAWLKSLMPWLKWDSELSKSCNAIIPFPTATNETEKQGVSYWLTMGIFMFSYLISNAVALYTIEAQIPEKANEAIKSDLQQKAMYRKSQMIISLIMLALISIIFIAVRLTSGCDTGFGLAVAIVPVTLLGITWFSILSANKNTRLSDLFGVSNRLLAPNATSDSADVCLPLS